jgi:hypothetical protein
LQSLPKQQISTGNINGACNSAASVAAESKISRRTSSFDLNNTCFLCGESTFNNSNHNKKSLSQGVKMVSNCLPTPNQFHETLLRICKERGDEWGECVSSRILGGFN